MNYSLSKLNNSIQNLTTINNDINFPPAIGITSATIIDVNLETIRGSGNLISLGTGLPDSGTQRVAIASGNLVDIDIQKLDGAGIKQNNGIAESGVQRVCIANDNDEIPIDLKQINGNTISTGAGDVTTGTQRFILANDREVQYSSFRKYYRGLLSINNMENLAQNIALNSQTTFSFQTTNHTFIKRIILCITDGQIKNNWANNISLNNGYKLFYKENNADADIDLTGTIRTNYGHLCYMGDVIVLKFANDDLLQAKITYEPPLYINDGTIGLHFLGADNYTGATSFTVQIEYYGD